MIVFSFNTDPLSCLFIGAISKFSILSCTSIEMPFILVQQQRQRLPPRALQVGYILFLKPVFSLDFGRFKYSLLLFLFQLWEQVSEY